MTLLALNLRLTPEERTAVRSSVDPEVADLVYLLGLSRYIDLDHPVTVAGINALETKGLLGPGRAAAVLGAPVQPAERPPAT
jgi:hypothetical protein